MKAVIDHMDSNLSDVLKKAQKENLTGELIGIFDKVLNIELNDLSHLITIAQDDLVTAPYTMKTKNIKRFNEIKNNLVSGEVVSFQYPGEIRIKGHSFNFDQAETWEKSLPTIDISAKDTKNRLNDLEYFLSDYGEPAGILTAYFKVYTQLALDSQKENRYDKYFIKRLSTITETTTVENLKKFIGLGIGLTPSGDDFLLGLISTLRCFGSATDLGEEIVEQLHADDIKNKTTKISYYMLKNAMNGQINGALFQYLTEQKRDRQTLEKIIKIGSTSGTDMLVGICFGLRYLLKIKRGE